MVSLIYSRIRIYLELQFIQDNTPRYVAGNTIRELAKRGTIAMFRLVFLLNLNPIKTIWN